MLSAIPLLTSVISQDHTSAGKEVDIGLDGGVTNPYVQRICYFTHGMENLMLIDAAQRKRVKYMAKCVAIGYGFLPFSFSFLGELEEDAITLLKWIRKFPMA
ncbi:hypothetical protein Tco_1479107 [Tanacetum coccineum]